MAIDKAIDSAKLNSDLRSIADSVRAKGNTTVLFKSAYEMKRAVDAIDTSKPEQEKSKTITDNGTFEITPDIGKVLNKVTINTQVPIPDIHTLLLLHGDSFVDSSVYNRPITNVGTTISTAKSKFGSSSILFNATNQSRIEFDYNSTLHLSNQDFTIDWWEYATKAKNGARFSTSYENWGGLVIGSGGNAVFAGTSSNNFDLIYKKLMIETTLNQWVHWAFVRNNNTLTSYKNGVQYASEPLNGSIWVGTGTGVVGAYSAQSSSAFQGYIDEFRVSDIARWTTDFTPPTIPYENFI